MNLQERIKGAEDSINALEKSDDLNSKQHQDIIKNSIDQHAETMAVIKDINTKLDPVLEIIAATKLLGKWAVAILSFIVILIGVITSWVKLLNIFKK